MKFDFQKFFLILGIFGLLKIPTIIRFGYPWQVFYVDLAFVSLIFLIFLVIGKRQQYYFNFKADIALKKLRDGLKDCSFFEKFEIFFKQHKIFDLRKLAKHLAPLTSKEEFQVADLLTQLYHSGILDRYYCVSKNGVIGKEKYLTMLDIPEYDEFIDQKTCCKDLDIIIFYKKNYNI